MQKRGNSFADEFRMTGAPASSCQETAQLFALCIQAGLTDSLLINRVQTGKNSNCSVVRVANTTWTKRWRATLLSMSPDYHVPPDVMWREGALLQWHSLQNTMAQGQHPVSIHVRNMNTNLNWGTFFKMFDRYSSKVPTSWEMVTDKEGTMGTWQPNPGIIFWVGSWNRWKDS